MGVMACQITGKSTVCSSPHKGPVMLKLPCHDAMIRKNVLIMFKHRGVYSYNNYVNMYQIKYDMMFMCNFKQLYRFSTHE